MDPVVRVLVARAEALASRPPAAKGVVESKLDLPGTRQGAEPPLRGAPSLSAIALLGLRLGDHATRLVCEKGITPSLPDACDGVCGQPSAPPSWRPSSQPWLLFSLRPFLCLPTRSRRAHREPIPMVCCTTYIATYCDVSTKKVQWGPGKPFERARNGSQRLHSCRADGPVLVMRESRCRLGPVPRKSPGETPT